MRPILLAIPFFLLLGCNDSDSKTEQRLVVANECYGKDIAKIFESDSAPHSIDGIILSRADLRKISTGSLIIAGKNKMHGHTIYPYATYSPNNKKEEEAKISKNKIIYYFDIPNFQLDDSDTPRSVKYREIFIINYPVLYNVSQSKTLNDKIKSSIYDSQFKIINQSHEANQAYLIDSCEFVKSESSIGNDVLGGVIDVKSVSIYHNGSSSFLSVITKGEPDTENGTELGLFVNPLYFDMKRLKLIKPGDIVGKVAGLKIDRVINNFFLKTPSDKFSSLRKDDWQLQFDEEGFFLMTNELHGNNFTGTIWAYVPFCSIPTF